MSAIIDIVMITLTIIVRVKKEFKRKLAPVFNHSTCAV